MILFIVERKASGLTAYYLDGADGNPVLFKSEAHCRKQFELMQKSNPAIESFWIE